MIQIVLNRPLLPAEHGNRLTNPDILLEIADRTRQRQCTDPNAGADEFSVVLSDIRMGGTWKRTHQGRLERAEEMLRGFLATQDGGEIAVLDLGASEGLTTLDLAAALRKRFGDRVHVVLADLNLWLERYRKGPVFEYRASDGEPIMVRIGRLGLRLARKRCDQKQHLDPLVALYLQCRSFRRTMQSDLRIPLVHPLVGCDRAVSVLQLDCLVRDDGLVKSFDAVRASNVLNSGYFTPNQIAIAVGNIHAYLRDGGFFIASRNLDTPSGEIENGSVWRKDRTRLRHIEDFGSGSEIKVIVDAWQTS